MPLPTQRDVADRVGLSQACVSKALRGAPGVSTETRDRVRAAAEAIGYRPDPVLSALVGRRGAEPPTTAIAYVRQVRAASDGVDDAYYPHVAGYCADIGLRLLEIEASGDDATLQAQLDRRRIAGVIMGHTAARRRLAWERMRVVHCGLLVPPERGDVVAPDLAAAVPAAYEAMTARGYRRIAAMLFCNEARFHSERVLAGALLSLERVVGDAKRLVTWIGPWSQLDEARAWARRQRPDAVLGYVGRHPEIGVPYAMMVSAGEVAGMLVPHREIAKAAVDLLLQRLREAPGSTPLRHTHLVEMSWHDGVSLPPRASRGAR